MKNCLLTLALAIGVLPASAAVQYEFRQSSHSQLENIPSVDFTGRAVIDGDRTRVDFLSGDAYPPGTYLITTNGSRNMTFVNPAKKAYVEINANNVAQAIGSSNLRVENFKSSSEPLDDHPVVAGYKTDHYRIRMTYDITLMLGQMPLKQSVDTTIDKWVSPEFADVSDGYLASGGIKTGNPDLDQLIDVETTKVKGLALKQRVQVTTTADAKGTNSVLKIDRTQTQTREMVISAIEITKPSPTAFIIPASYHRSDGARDDSQKTPVHELTFDSNSH